MGTAIHPRSGSAEAQTVARFLAAVLAVGAAIAVATVIAERRSPSGSLPAALVWVEGVVCLFVIATTIELAKSHSHRKLFMVGLATTATPFGLLAVLMPSVSGGHDSAGFSLLYYTWASVACGISLLIVAGVRFLIERRQERLSARN